MTRNVLPTDLVPTHYDLSINGLDLTAWIYSGSVAISYQLAQPTDTVHLNYRHDLRLDQASFTATGEDGSVLRAVSIDMHDEVMTVKLDGTIQSQTLVVTTAFTAAIRDDLCGFYRNRYIDATSGKPAIQLSTSFESTDARSALPCADEPALKASLTLHLEVPNHWTALANMPVDRQEPSRAGHKIVHFVRSPPMSTYLFAWACGEFEYIEQLTDRVYSNGQRLPVRVYTTPGLKDQGRLALETACKVVDFFSDQFELDYVLPKLDLIACHEFSHNAMENWGLVTYRTTSLLYDSKTMNPSYEHQVTYVVAHELAHQWFGNLVTMDWWDELWLNEGFATWAGFYAVEHIYPDRDMFSMFVATEMQDVYGVDAVRGSHPIEVPVRSGFDIDQIFDDISYRKGASVIRMLSSRIGDELFIRGVALYLKRFQYGNATSADLWKAVEEVSGTSVQVFMDIWIKKLGYPIVTVTEHGNSIRLRQDRFLSSGDVTPDDNQTLWWLPLAISFQGATTEKEPVQIMDGRELVLDISCSFKLNTDVIGFYRVNYSNDRLLVLGHRAAELTVKDRIGLVSDALAAAGAGLASITSLLAFLKEFATTERNYYVWKLIVEVLHSISIVFGADTAIGQGIKKYTQDLIESCLQDRFASFEPSPGEDYVTLMHRQLMFEVAGAAGVQWVVDECKRRFALWAAHRDDSTAAIPSSLKSVVFKTVVANSSGSELDAVFGGLIAELKSPQTLDGRETAGTAFGALHDPTAISRLYSEVIDAELVQVQDAHYLFKALTANPVTRASVLEYFESHWPYIMTRYGTNTAVIERLVRFTFANFASQADWDRIQALYADKDTRAYNRSLAQALDAVKRQYLWVERDRQGLASWF